MNRLQAFISLVFVGFLVEGVVMGQDSSTKVLSPDFVQTHTPTIASSIPMDTPSKQAMGRKALTGEGYKGVPWGTSINDFVELRKIKVWDEKGEYPNAGEIEIKSPDILGSDWDSRLTYLILGVPEDTDPNVVAHSPDSELCPNKFQSISDKEVHYIFYESKLVMAESQIESTDFLNIKQTLSRKYGSPVLCKELSWENGINRTDVEKAYKFFKSKTEVYLLRSYSTGSEETPFGDDLLYVSSNFKKIFTNEVKELKMERNKGRSRERKKEIDSDLNKVE